MANSLDNEKYDTINSTLICIVILWATIFAISFKNVFIDDAYTGFTYLKNFLHANGFVFNKGEYVEGIVNAGWLFFLIPMSSFFTIPTAAKITSIALTLLNFILIFKIAKIIFENQILPSFICLGTVFSYNYMFFSYTGMETPLISTMLNLSIFLYIYNYVEASLIVVALATAVRPETVLILPFYFIFSLRRSNLKHSSLIMLLTLSIVFFIELLRYWYFGAMLPNAFIAKYTNPIELQTRISLAVFMLKHLINLDVLFANYASVILILIGFYKIRKRPYSAIMFSITLCGYLFSIYTKTDWTGMGRYFAPYIPVALILLYSGIEALLDSFGDITMTTMLFAGFTAAICFAGYNDYLKNQYLLDRNDFPAYAMNMKPASKIGKWISENTPRSSTIAASKIGCLSYYANRNILDYRLGQTNKEIAKLVMNAQPFNNPNNRRLSKLWHKFKPNYIFEDSFIIKRLYQNIYGDYIVNGYKYKLLKTFPINGDRHWKLLTKY